MYDVTITSAQYVTLSHDSNVNDHILAVIDGVELSIPLVTGNRHYDEIMRQVKAGTLTIQDAD